MPIKKSELYSSLWESADQLRGGMDASQYKDYVLVLLFMKYVSDKYGGDPAAVIQVPAGGSFADMVKLKNKKDIGDGINKIIHKLAEANDLVGVITVADFNDENKLGKGSEMVDRLTKLIGIFQNPALDFSKNRAEGDDLLGDAYEYLMRHFATDSGKSKGQFYTPAEVSRIMAQVIGIKYATRPDQTLYDPTCGSSSLLLRAADEAPHQVSIYGQEKDNATRALAKMNMILHGHPTAEIVQGNTLSNPLFRQGDGLKRFDFVVANAPFSDKAWSNGVNTAEDPFGRFEGFGVPPPKNGDYAYLLHVLASMKSTGKGAIILPHGVLFRGNAEAEIRKQVVQRGYIKGIIGLPPNLFYGTGIPACIIVFDKENAAARKGIFMVDASKGFMKDGNKNRLRHQDIHKIVDVFNKQIEIEKYSRMVPLSEVSDPKNDFNLNLPRYIDSSEPEDIQDIAAHLWGGIPQRDLDALDKYWQVCPSLQSELFAPSARAGYCDIKVEPSQVKQVIFAHPEFVAYQAQVEKTFADWRALNTPALKNLEKGFKPKQLIAPLSEALLQAFANVPLLDAYDIYQHLMTYWAETMQDDAYLLAVDGWQGNPELIPEALVVQRFFATEQQAIAELENERDRIARAMEELEEEHGGEDGLLADAKTDAGNLTKTSVQKRLKEIAADKSADDESAADEVNVLKQYARLLEQQAAATKAVRDAQKQLSDKVTAKYKTLTQEEIKTLVVDDKWMATLHENVQGELERVSQALAQRIKDLAERYATPMPQLEQNVETLRVRVDAHLNKMGYAWN